jgi:hypothetical protein
LSVRGDDEQKSVFVPRFKSGSSNQQPVTYPNENPQKYANTEETRSLRSNGKGRERTLLAPLALMLNLSKPSPVLRSSVVHVSEFAFPWFMIVASSAKISFLKRSDRSVNCCCVH